MPTERVKQALEAVASQIPMIEDEIDDLKELISFKSDQGENASEDRATLATFERRLQLLKQSLIARKIAIPKRMT